MTEWRTETDAAAVADAACRLIGMAARSAIAERGKFRLVLSGGSTPQATYQRLSCSDQDWKRWVLYYGDERCLPADNEGRNSRMVIGSGIADRAGKHYPIPTELGAKAAASRYRERIKSAQPFDLVLLGMGADGHTASLFPGHDWPDKSVFPVKDAPPPWTERVTLGIKALQNCRSMLILVAGEDKAEAVRRWRNAEDLPITRVSSTDHSLVLVERNCLEFADDQSSLSTEALKSNA